ncbi:MAG: hypothetical protein C0412_05565 [Flavobacterium sp.]|nr:hypothetical protein [Flavobacterium sp.]
MKDISFEIKIPKFKLSDQRKLRLKLALSVAMVVGAFAAKQYFEHTIVGTLILAYFGLSLLWGWSSRISASGALLFLAGCPALLILKNDALAETFAIYAYYLLVITVVGEIVDLKRHPEQD